MDGNLSNIVCPQCGTSNASNTNFCIKCGTKLGSTTEASTPVQNAEPISNIGSTLGTVSTVSSSFVSQSNLNMFQFFINAIIKPFDNFHNNEEGLKDIKHVGILSGILVGALTLLNLISTIINTVRSKSPLTNQVTWAWEKLSNVQWIKVIGTDLLMYAGILVAIAGLYFLGSLILKKSANFVQLLGATTASFVPYCVFASILSPILGMINGTLGLIVTIIGIVYTLIIVIELMNHLIEIPNPNIRMIFHAICLAIFFTVISIIIKNMIVSSIQSSLGALLFGML